MDKTKETFKNAQELLKSVNVKALPDALKKNLSKTYVDGSTTLDDFFNSIKRYLDTPLSIDDILIIYYKETTNIVARQTMTNWLNKLIERQLVEREERKYSLLKEKDKEGGLRVVEK